MLYSFRISGLAWQQTGCRTCVSILIHLGGQGSKNHSALGLGCIGFLAF
jgi:hypothetical protein